MPSTFQQERDSIVLLGLLSIAYKNFDFQFKHSDGELTHQNGLNIFASIIDNADGELIGQQQNQIHRFNNPMLHAEQLSLKEAIERINVKRSRTTSTTSVENYYRKYLFNHPTSGDYLSLGSTLYTTLEPCPFCASALLVNRMKRIVFLIPDKKFGDAFGKLKSDYYPNYDIKYEPLKIEAIAESRVVTFAEKHLSKIISKVDSIKVEFPNIYDTLLVDFMGELLKEAYEFFIVIGDDQLITTDTELKRNMKTLNGFRAKLGIAE